MLYLASKSSRRKEILKMLGIDFNVIENTFNEDLIKLKSPIDFVLQASVGKAESAVNKINNGFILGVDTIGYFNNEFLFKPKDKNDAINTLKKLRANKHVVYSGITILKLKNSKIIDLKSIYAKTEVFFSDYNDELIYKYVNSGKSLDKAASYGIQDEGALFVKKINGCFYNVMGLPIYELNIVLKEIKYKY